MTKISEDILEFFLVCGALILGLYCIALVIWGSVAFASWLIQVTG